MAKRNTVEESKFKDFIEYYGDATWDLALKSEPPLSYKIYYKMINDDTHIYMLTQAIKTIISKRYTSINVVGGKEQEFVGEMINKMKPNLYNFLGLASEYLFYGLAVFQKEYEYDSNKKKYYLKKLHYINPASIYEIKDKSIVFSAVKNNTIDTVEIKKDNLFLIYDGNDIMTSSSVLRASYKLYKIKSYLLQLFPVAISKSAVYIPVAYTKGKINKNKEQEIDAMLSNINAMYNARAVVSSDLIERIDGLQDKRNPYPFDNDIEFLNKEISKAVIGNILSIGTDKSVQYAVQDINEYLFYGHIWDILDRIIDKFNIEIIEPLMEINFGEVDIMPKLVVKRVGKIIGENVDTRALFNLAQYGLITPDEELENWLRSNFGLPIKEEVEV